MPMLRVKKVEKDSPGEDVTKDVDAVAKDLAALKKAASDLLSWTLSDHAAWARAFAARSHSWRGILMLSRWHRDMKET
jgi:hypothetical protein